MLIRWRPGGDHGSLLQVPDDHRQSTAGRFAALARGPRLPRSRQLHELREVLRPAEGLRPREERHRSGHDDGIRAILQGMTPDGKRTASVAAAHRMANDGEDSTRSVILDS